MNFTSIALIQTYILCMIAREHIYIITRYILRASPPQNDPTTTRAAHLKLPRFWPKPDERKERDALILFYGEQSYYQCANRNLEPLNSKQKFVPQLNCNKTKNLHRSRSKHQGTTPSNCPFRRKLPIFAHHGSPNFLKTAAIDYSALKLEKKNL